MSLKKLIVTIVLLSLLLCSCIFALWYILYGSVYNYGVYEINIASHCVSNNSVGNEWSESYTIDGEIVLSGKTITAPLDKITTKTLIITITEQDKFPDTACENMTFILNDNINTKKTVTVVENNGRYKGNISKWEIIVSTKLIRKLREYDNVQ